MVYAAGNQNVKNTLLQAIQQDIQKATPTTVCYNQKGLDRSNSQKT